MGAEKIVWLLGSGFSKPLGGPLLRDLFRQEREEDLRARFPDDQYPDLAKSLPWVQEIFHSGVKDGLWENAEQFMAYVDDAYQGDSYNPDRVQVAHLIKRASVTSSVPGFTDYKDSLASDFNLKVKRALAAECFRFTMNAKPKTDHKERWDPYLRWVGTLAEGTDTVISLNYDLVVEMAAEALERGNINALKPRDLQLRGKVPLLKLHGSVDWITKIGPRGPNPEVHASEGILQTPTDSIAIAAPGGSKARFVDSYLKPLWRQAEAALKEATYLMIVGYSFPDTDSNAQARLLSALRGGGPDRRQVSIVLGNDTSATQKVVSLVKSTASGRRIMETENPMNLATTGGRVLNIVTNPLSARQYIGDHVHVRSAFLDGRP